MRDLREAIRMLRRDAGYAAVVAVTLALTIGVTTAVFSIVDGVLLKPLAYRESRQLVYLREIWRQASRRAAPMEVNERHFEYWRARARSFASLAQYVSIQGNLTGAGDAAQVAVVHASGSLFDVVQVKAPIGRVLTPDDERAQAADVAVIADGLWRRRFGADPAVVGRTIAIDGVPRTIVGVLDAGFRLPGVARLVDAFDAIVPIKMDTERVGWVGDHNNAAIGRLAPGVTPEQAQAELDVLQTQVGERASIDAHETVTLSSAVTPIAEVVVGTARRGLLLLLAAIGAVLFIACSNLANLSLTRTASRQRDAAIRAALGASRANLIGRVVIEQLVLSFLGGASGLLVAWASLRAFVRTAPIDLPRATEATLDARVFAFAALLSVGAGLLVALVPAWRTAMAAAQPVLKASGNTLAGDRGAMRTRGTLLAVQVALSVMLLVTTALLSVSFMRLVNVDRGFAADGVLAVNVALPVSHYPEEAQRLAVYDRLLDAIHQLPGVESLTTSSMLPLAGQGQVNFVATEGDTRPRSGRPTANFRFVAPDFFRTLGVSVLRGRAFGAAERDPDRPAPALVSARTAAQLWPGQDAIGMRFSRGEPGEQGFEVVGIVTDARTTTLEAAPPLMAYVPYWWRTRTSALLLIKTRVDPASLMPAVRKAVREIDADIAIGESRPVDGLVDRALAPRRYQMQLFVAFGAVALAIALIGIYATTAYGVARRGREMNIRVALGARTGDVVGMVVRQGSAPIAAGVAAGTVGALALGGVAASLHFDVSARDPLIVSATVSVVAAVGLAACLVAARRNLAIDPAAALREE